MSDTDQPNIVLVSWDSVRADHMPMYGYDRNTTPFVAEKVQNTGTVFEDTFVSAVGTPASFTGLFTGEHADGNMLDPSPDHWRQANADRTMLAEHLQDGGYYTGAVHFNALMSSHFGWDRGWDEYHDGMWDKEPAESAEVDGGFDLKKYIYDFLQERDMANFAVHLKKMVAGERPDSWDDLGSTVEEFIEEAPEPWFLWVLLIDTHHPYLPPSHYQEWPQYGVRATYASNYVMRRRRDLVGERRQKIVNAYDNSIRYADEFMRKLDQKLREEGYGDVPVFLHSDHGDELGEHANYGHRPLMYNTLTRVPLISWNTGLVDRISGPNTLLDLGNLLLDIADVDASMGEGYSLVGSDQRDVVTVRNDLGEYGVAGAAVGEGWKVLHHPEGDWGHGGYIDPGREAYPLTDVRETTDRYGEHPDAIETVLDEVLVESDVGEGTESGDAEVRERLAELGYLE